MKRSYYRFTHFAAYLTIIHGTFYFAIKYFFQVEGPYGERPHWSQSYLQSAHVLLSPLLLFVFGMLWKDHILSKLRNSLKKRKSGIALLAAMCLMIFSGYGIQAFYGESLKAVQVWTHLIASGAFIFVYLLHHFIRKQ